MEDKTRSIQFYGNFDVFYSDPSELSTICPTANHEGTRYVKQAAPKQLWKNATVLAAVDYP